VGLKQKGVAEDDGMISKNLEPAFGAGAMMVS